MQQFKIQGLSNLIMDQRDEQIVLIEVATRHKRRDGSPCSIVRSWKQFSSDLRRAGYPADLNWCKRTLIGGSITGEIAYVEAGSEYVATAESTAVKKKRAKEGDILIREEAGFRVEGFPTLLVNAYEAQQLSQANAQMVMNMKDPFAALVAGLLGEPPAINDDGTAASGQDDPEEEVDEKKKAAAKAAAEKKKAAAAKKAAAEKKAAEKKAALEAAAG